MAKYLIEDIIPPEKKRAAKKKNPAGRSIPIETHEAEALPEVPAKPSKTTETKKPISEAYPEDPKNMLVDQMRGDAESASTEITPHATIDPADEKPLLGTSGWSQNSGIKSDAPTQETLTRFPPQVPEYAPKNLSYDDGRSGFRTWLPWLSGVAVFLIVAYVTLGFFGGATVTVVQKSATLPLDQEFTAFKSAASGKLPYAVMIEKASSTAEVAATGEKSVTTKAEGQIVVYNEQTSAQRLIKNTRFQSPSGKIYRIRDSITIPKGTLSGGTVKPGSFEVTVYADEAGEAYNSPPVDFTVPGLKNTAIYDKVYARSKGPLAGGASGIVKTVSDQDLQRAGEDLRVELETKLRAKARGNLAGSQIAFDKGIVVALEPPKLLNASASAANKAVISVEGTIAVITFKRSDLTKAVVEHIAPENAKDAIEIQNLDALTFSADATKVESLLLENKIDFTLKGMPELSWTIDAQAIQNALVGLPKSRFNEIISQYASVEHAKARIRPIWKLSFPEESSEIAVEVVDTLERN